IVYKQLILLFIDHFPELPILTFQFTQHIAYSSYERVGTYSRDSLIVFLIEFQQLDQNLSLMRFKIPEALIVIWRVERWIYFFQLPDNFLVIAGISIFCP